jgi:hypothetical protein
VPGRLRVLAGRRDAELRRKVVCRRGHRSEYGEYRTKRLVLAAWDAVHCDRPSTRKEYVRHGRPCVGLELCRAWMTSMRPSMAYMRVPQRARSGGQCCSYHPIR